MSNTASQTSIFLVFFVVSVVGLRSNYFHSKIFIFLKTNSLFSKKTLKKRGLVSWKYKQERQNNSSIRVQSMELDNQILMSS